MRYVSFDFEIGKGSSDFREPKNLDFGSPEELQAHVINEHSHWVSPHQVADLTGNSGIFVRQSRDRGALWFAVPGQIHSFHAHDGVIFCVKYPGPDTGGQYVTYLSLAFHRMTGQSPGVRNVPDALITNIIGSAVVVAFTNSLESAVETTCAEITRRFALLGEISR